MQPPEVSEGEWIKFGKGPTGSGQDGYVLRKYSDAEIEVGYYQNRLKAIGENLIWTGERWDFKYQGPNGRYLRDREEQIVKAGPPQ